MPLRTLTPHLRVCKVQSSDGEHDLSGRDQDVHWDLKGNRDTVGGNIFIKNDVSLDSGGGDIVAMVTIIVTVNAY